jgi:hypothetical protein
MMVEKSDDKSKEVQRGVAPAIDAPTTFPSALSRR